MASKSNALTKRIGFMPNRDIPIYLLIAPAVLLLLVFHYIPIYGIIIGFKDYSPFKGVMASNWVGLKHFKEFITDPTYWNVMKNTIIINIFSNIFISCTNNFSIIIK